MVRTRFYNGLVLPGPGEGEPFFGEVWTDGDRISYVGEPREAAPQGFERNIDLRGDLVLPGFKNAHTHSAMTFLRCFADGLPLNTWLFERVFPYEARLTPESVYALTRLAILEYLAGGVTAAFDMYFHREAYAAAVTDCSFRSVICGALMAGDDPELAARDYERFNSYGPLVSYAVGAHAEYTASDELLRALSELTHAKKAPFWAHNSETASETAECAARHGMSPTEYFDSLGLFDYGGGGFHCVHLTERDMAILSRPGLTAVSCPGSNAKLASGVAPLAELRRRGASIALGTDGPASNNALDMFREMYLSTALQNLRLNDASAFPASAALRAATTGGALAMGLRDCASLAPGQKADLTVIDLSRPNMRPRHSIEASLVYSAGAQNVRLTMIDGKVLYEDGQYYIGDDPSRIYAEAERVTKELTKDEA